jgi:hypothetical protein
MSSDAGGHLFQSGFVSAGRGVHCAFFCSSVDRPLLMVE